MQLTLSLCPLKVCIHEPLKKEKIQISTSISQPTDRPTNQIRRVCRSMLQLSNVSWHRKVSTSCGLRTSIRSIFTSHHFNCMAAAPSLFRPVSERNICMWYFDTYCSMSQYFIRPSLPALTIRPASFFPFTIMNFSWIDSILKDKSDDVWVSKQVSTSALNKLIRKAEFLVFKMGQSNKHL